MAASLINAGLVRAASVALLVAAIAAVAQTPPSTESTPLDIEAASVDFDYRNNTALLHDVTFKQGAIEIKAREALAIGDINDFKDNTLTFRKDVRITTVDGSLQSDSAEVTFHDNRMVRAVIVGTPATFERKVQGTEDTARGRAGTIVYDVSAETLRLRDEAYFNYGGKDITAQNVVYNLRSDTVIANGGNSGEQTGKPVRITIDPDTAKKQTPPQ